MKIFTTGQIKNWDAFTIKEACITSLELMEQAAQACSLWISNHLHSTGPNRELFFFCGQGNNGGDGLAIARLLLEQHHLVHIFIINNGISESHDFSINLKRLEQAKIKIQIIKGKADIPYLKKDDLVIDAIFGTGCKQPIPPLSDFVILQINQSGCEIVSIDIPSGMLSDICSKDFIRIKATQTLAFSQKLCFMMAENGDAIGNLHLLDIGLSKTFEQNEPAIHDITYEGDIMSMLNPRNRFGHKGLFGEGLILAGSKGMMGAAILAAKGFLRSGAGKLTCHIPECGYEIMQTAVPEAMCITTGNNHHEAFVMPPPKTNALAAGPGMGLQKENVSILKAIFKWNIPMVLDADALNTISENKTLLENIPVHTILTPHPLEFERLFGSSNNDFERLEKARGMASKYKINIILKGHHAAFVSVRGHVYFNSTGNSGMAKPGSGDVLTGFLTGLLATGYDAETACRLGMYIHGLAGDIAAQRNTEEGMTAQDLIMELGNAWKHFKT